MKTILSDNSKWETSSFTENAQPRKKRNKKQKTHSTNLLAIWGELGYERLVMHHPFSMGHGD
jgi:hypothetical protein